MSMPSTGGVGGTGWFFLIAGIILLIKKNFILILKVLALVAIALILLMPTLLRASSMTGSHWDSFGNDDGIVLRGATRQCFPLLSRAPFNIVIEAAENHAFGLNGSKPWNRKVEPAFGLAMTYDFSTSTVNGVLRTGGQGSYGIRADTCCFNLTPFFDAWVGWSGSLPGSSWLMIKKEGFGDGPVGRFFFEQGVEALRLRPVILIPQVMFQGSYGTKPYSWNRKIEVGPGFKVIWGSATITGHYLWPKQSLRFQVSWWIDWNLKQPTTKSDNTIPNIKPPVKPVKSAILLFDCGIGGELIDEYLKILRDYKVSAVFGLVGQELVRRPDMLAKIRSLGHGIANHSWSHPHFGRLTNGEVLNELRKVDSIVGQQVVLVRPPYSDVDSRILGIFSAYGYQAFMPTIEVADWESTATTDSIIERLNRRLDDFLEHEHEHQTTLILLLHLAGGNPENPTLRALPEVIEILKEKGYVFRLP